MAELFANALDVHPDERKVFLKFARSNGQSASNDIAEHHPWLPAPTHTSSKIPSDFSDDIFLNMLTPLDDPSLNASKILQLALRNFGNLLRHQGDYVQAEQYYKKSLIICREYGLKDDISHILFSLGLLALHRNNYSKAAKYFTDFFDLAKTVYEKKRACDFLTGVAAVAAGNNEPERAAKLSGAARVLLENTDIPYAPLDIAEFERHMQIARSQIGEHLFETFAAEGRAMSMERACAYALE